MEYLRIHPDKFKYRFVNESKTDHKFACFYILQKYMETNIYCDYLSSLNENSLKNIWNFVVKRWMITRESCETSHPKSKYSHQVYEYDHSHLSHLDLDVKLQEFIGKDRVKALYVVKSLQRYLFP